MVGLRIGPGSAFLTGIPLRIRQPSDFAVPTSRRAVCCSGRGRPPAERGAVPAARGAGLGGAPGGRRLPASAPDPGPAPVTLRCARPHARRPPPMAPSRLQLGLRAAYSGLSSVAGFSIFLVWTVVYSQPGTAAMGGLAGTQRRGECWGPGRGGVGERSASEAHPGQLFPWEQVGCLPKNIRWQRGPLVARAFSGCHWHPMHPEPRRNPGCRRRASEFCTHYACGVSAARCPMIASSLR